MQTANEFCRKGLINKHKFNKVSIANYIVYKVGLICINSYGIQYKKDVFFLHLFLLYSDRCETLYKAHWWEMSISNIEWIMINHMRNILYKYLSCSNLHYYMFTSMFHYFMHVAMKQLCAWLIEYWPQLSSQSILSPFGDIILVLPPFREL